jgi:predicted ATP-grasp superfamily ATP-dependent carboligase
VREHPRSVFLYEFITGGGCWSLGNDPPSGSLLAEGMAMRDALACDLAAIKSVERVILTHDVRLPRPQLASHLSKVEWLEVDSHDSERRLVCDLTRANESTILIAPEFQDLLLARVRMAEASGGSLISPGSSVVALASDKQRCAEFLAGRGLPVPWGQELAGHGSAIDPALFPAVLKPVDGAGSWLLQRITDQAALRGIDLTAAPRWRLEKYHAGMAASVALLSGPSGLISLAPCAQMLSQDGRFTYLGGRLPLPPPVARRAETLALNIGAALPPFRGYLGLDLVLGLAEDGSEDVCIEINPRLTTSYVGLRQMYEQNLALAMLRTAAGIPLPLTTTSRTIEFAADGSLRTLPAALPLDDLLTLHPTP